MRMGMVPVPVRMGLEIRRAAPGIGLFLRRALLVDPSPHGAEAPPVSTPNGHRMATTADPRHGGGTTGRVRVRMGTLAPCRRPAARVRGDRGPGYGRRPKRIAKRQ